MPRKKRSGSGQGKNQKKGGKDTKRKAERAAQAWPKSAFQAGFALAIYKTIGLQYPLSTALLSAIIASWQ